MHYISNTFNRGSPKDQSLCACFSHLRGSIQAAHVKHHRDRVEGEAWEALLQKSIKRHAPDSVPDGAWWSRDWRKRVKSQDPTDRAKRYKEGMGLRIAFAITPLPRDNLSMVAPPHRPKQQPIHMWPATCCTNPTQAGLPSILDLAVSLLRKPQWTLSPRGF